MLTNRGWESPARHRLRRLAADCALVRGALLALGRLSTRFAGVIDYITSLPAEDARNRAYTELLMQDSPDAQEIGSGYGSSDAIAEFNVTLGYAQICRGEHSADRTGTLDAVQNVDRMFSALAAADPSVATCLNFGVSYAHVDATLAEQFPAITFIGLDRSPLTKTLNELAFPAIENLAFIADDIFKVLNTRRFERGVFLHCRTLVQMPASFITRLYERAYAAGFEYVIGVEPVGLSRASGSDYPYTDQMQPSALFRDNLFLHNYPGLLASAGYAVQTIDLARTNHPHEDYRLLCFLAKRAAPDGHAT